MPSGSAVDAQMHRFTLVFDDAALERRFRPEFTARRARAARVSITAGAPGYLLVFLIIDDADARRLVFRSRRQPVHPAARRRHGAHSRQR